MKFKEQFVQRDQHRIYAREYAGPEPAIILTHGFPDNLHLYDRLLPYLSPPRRIVTLLGPLVQPRLQASVRRLPRGLPAREYHIRMIMSETCQRRLC